MVGLGIIVITHLGYYVSYGKYYLIKGEPRKNDTHTPAINFASHKSQRLGPPVRVGAVACTHVMTCDFSPQVTKNAIY